MKAIKKNQMFYKRGTISGSFGQIILENKRPSFLALNNNCQVSNCSLQKERAYLQENEWSSHLPPIKNEFKFNYIPQIWCKKFVSNNFIELKESFCNTSCTSSSFITYLTEIQCIINMFINNYHMQTK